MSDPEADYYLHPKLEELNQNLCEWLRRNQEFQLRLQLWYALLDSWKYPDTQYHPFATPATHDAIGVILGFIFTKTQSNKAKAYLRKVIKNKDPNKEIVFYSSPPKEGVAGRSIHVHVQPTLLADTTRSQKEWKLLEKALAKEGFPSEFSAAFLKYLVEKLLELTSSFGPPQSESTPEPASS